MYTCNIVEALIVVQWDTITLTQYLLLKFPHENDFDTNFPVNTDSLPFSVFFFVHCMDIYLSRQVAMRLLEKDIHDKQDTLISLRRQLEDVKKLNLELHNKLQVLQSAAYVVGVTLKKAMSRGLLF